MVGPLRAALSFSKISFFLLLLLSAITLPLLALLIRNPEDGGVRDFQKLFDPFLIGTWGIL